MTDLNLTALQNSTGIGGTFCTVNTSTEGVLIGAFLIATFFIMLFVLKKWDFEKGLLVASWSSFIISLIATATTCTDGSRLLNPYYALAFLSIASLTAFYIWATDSS